MQFLIRAYDGEGKLDKRMEVRPRHLCHPSDYKLPFPSDCLVSNGIADAVTGKATDPFPSYSCNLKRSQTHMAVSGSL